MLKRNNTILFDKRGPKSYIHTKQDQSSFASSIGLGFKHFGNKQKYIVWEAYDNQSDVVVNRRFVNVISTICNSLWNVFSAIGIVEICAQ